MNGLPGGIKNKIEEKRTGVGKDSRFLLDESFWGFIFGNNMVCFQWNEREGDFHARGCDCGEDRRDRNSKF